MSNAPRILACTTPSALADFRRWLGEAGYEVSGHLPDSPGLDGPGAFHLAIIDSGSRESSLELCRRLRASAEEVFLPLLFLTDDPSPAARIASLQAGADACLVRPFEPAELLAQVGALLRIKGAHDRLAEKAAEVHRLNKRLQQAYQQIDQELELAQRLQSSFLPQTLPQVPRVRFAVHYVLCGRVGGDFYDVFRLDECHVGFYVADAMGHGVPASLLTIFVKKGVKAKEVFGQQYRLVPPDEVLSRLNRDLIDQELSEHPFITMVYALLNHQQGTLSFARAGHPYPLYIPREGPLVLWKQEGLLLGVLEASFPCQIQPLRPGDKVLLYTDGLDSASFEGHPPGVESLVVCAERHRDLPVQDFIARLAHDLLGNDPQTDDLTLLALELGD